MTPSSSVLNGSVGFLGQNQPSDVQTIQSLLNGVPGQSVGPAGKLAVDGICGPLTTGAIKQFQSANGCPTDGRIDPGMTTEKALVALLQLLGLLAKILGGKGGVVPVPPVQRGKDSPIHKKYVATAKGLLPPIGKLTAGTGGGGFAACGEFPGRVFRHLPVKFPGQPGCFSINVPPVGRMFLFTPTIGWENFGLAVDQQLKPSQPCWRLFVGLRPCRATSTSCRK